MNPKYTSRKWWLSLISISLLTILLFSAKIDQGVFANLFGLIVSGYLLSNVSQKYVESKKETKDDA